MAADDTFNLFDTDEERVLLHEAIDEPNFLIKNEKIAEVAEGFNRFLGSRMEYPVLVPEIEGTIIGTLDWLTETYTFEFTDIFCLHWMQIIDPGQLPIWKGFVNYIIDHTELRSTRRSLERVWPAIELDDKTFKKVVFDKISEKSSMGRLETFLDYYYGDGTRFAENLWNSTEVKEIVEKAILEKGDLAVYKVISDSIRQVYLRAPIKDPSFITPQLETVLAVAEVNGFQTSVNTLRGSRYITSAKNYFQDNLAAVLSGKQFLADEAFQEYERLFDDSAVDSDGLNASYNRHNSDINYILKEKIGLADMAIDGGFFNLTEPEKAIPFVSRRLSFEKIKHQLVDELWKSFDLSCAEQVVDVCLDYLAIGYCKLVEWRTNHDLPIESAADNAWSWIKFVDDFAVDNGLSFSVLAEEESFATDSPINEISQRFQEIDRIDVLERVFDLPNFKVQEKGRVYFRENGDEPESFEYDYVGSIPFRYFRLLTLDHCVFDQLKFSFFGREIDLKNDSLAKNTVDCIFRNNLNAPGFVSTCFLDNKSTKLLEAELFLNRPREAFKLSLGSPGFPIPDQANDEYLPFLLERKYVPTDKKTVIAQEFVDEEKEKLIFRAFGSDILDLLNDVYKTCLEQVGVAPINSQIYGHAAEQTNRLRVIRTPGDLEFWYNTTQRNAISAKNKARGDAINYLSGKQNVANDTLTDLIDFYPIDPYTVGSIHPSLTLVDVEQKKIHCVTLLYSGNELRPWYFKNEYTVDEDLVKKLYTQNLIEPGFLEKYKIDLSGICENGPWYFQELVDYLSEEKTLVEKFTKHSLDLFLTMQNFSVVGQRRPDGVSIGRKIINDQFERALQISAGFMVNEKRFLQKFLGFPYRMDTNIARMLSEYLGRRRQFVTETIQKEIQKFDASFAAKLDSWNSDEYSITIGGGGEGGTYFIFAINTDAISLVLPSPNIFGFDLLPTVNPQIL